MDAFLLYVYAFSLGSVPSAYILARVLKGIDLRLVGSGTLGASNIGVQIGRIWMVPVILFDLVGKGMSPVLLGQTLLASDLESFSVVIAPVIALIGHNWCLCLKFDGGRGILVVIGSAMVLAPEVCGVLLVSLLCVWIVTRNVPFSVLVSLMMMPFGAWALNGDPRIFVFTALAVVLVLVKRVSGNRGRQAKYVSKRSMLVNRILFDRDIANRLDWIN